MPKGKKVASVAATLLIEDAGVFSSEPFPEMKATAVKLVATDYGDETANFGADESH